MRARVHFFVFSLLMSSRLSVGRPYENISSSTTLGVRPMSEVSYSPCNPGPFPTHKRARASKLTMPRMG